MFETSQLVDPIVTLMVDYHNDTNLDKVNLGIGVYQDDMGATPVLQCVKQAEVALVETQTSKSYIDIDGLQAFNQQVEMLLLGANHPIIKENRITTVQTPGGTAALRLAGELLKQLNPFASVWLSTPTWLNHAHIFGEMGFSLNTYPYFNSTTHQLDFDAMLAKLNTVPKGDLVVLQTACHNPTGVDLTESQWQEIIEVAEQQQFLTLIDTAYQGFGVGLSEDVASIKAFAQCNLECFITYSFSKNMGLYNERVGALCVLTKTAKRAANTLTQIKHIIRAIYSFPPAHGAYLVNIILSNNRYYALWQQELAVMKERIIQLRTSFVKQLASHALSDSFASIAKERGMFSLIDLTLNEITALRKGYHIYLLNSGRINITGITSDNLAYLCECIAKVKNE